MGDVLWSCLLLLSTYLQVSLSKNIVYLFEAVLSKTHKFISFNIDVIRCSAYGTATSKLCLRLDGSIIGIQIRLLML